VPYLRRTRRGWQREWAVLLEDDLDGCRAGETVRCGPGGTRDEIDLNNKNAPAFGTQLAPYLGHAARLDRDRHAGRREPQQAASGGGIRAWAEGHGIPVSARGRIAASVLEQYEAATKRS